MERLLHPIQQIEANHQEKEIHRRQASGEVHEEKQFAQLYGIGVDWIAFCIYSDVCNE
jgi:hypothetical protein